MEKNSKRFSIGSSLVIQQEFPSVDTVVSDEILSEMGHVLRIVVLHESMRTGEFGLDEWNQGFVEYLSKQEFVHMPSKMQIPVRPFLEIPAHRWTFTGCFALLG